MSKEQSDKQWPLIDQLRSVDPTVRLIAAKEAADKLVAAQAMLQRAKERGELSESEASLSHVAPNVETAGMPMGDPHPCDMTPEEREEQERIRWQKLEDEERARREAREAEDRASRMRIEEQERQARAEREEADRKAREKQERNQAALSEIQGIQQQVIIAQCGRAGVRTGGTIECIEETLAETETWEIDAERFGVFTGAAFKAKEDAVAKIRALLAAAKARAAEEAKLKEERDRLEAERLAAEARAAAERRAEEDRLRREREAQEFAERAEREKVEAEQRAVEAEKRKAAEEEEKLRREIQRQQDELLDARALLASFKERFGHLQEFRAVVKAIDSCLIKQQKAA